MLYCSQEKENGEPDTMAVDAMAVDAMAVNAMAVDAMAAISQKVDTMAAVSYHIINTYLYVHIYILWLNRCMICGMH